MNEFLKAALANFKPVHSGGHHDVFCDGSCHIWASGHECGYVGITNAEQVVRLRQGKCDCANWK